MKAITVNAYGGPEVLQQKEVQKPSIQDHEILIKIKASSVTAASSFIREGKPYLGRLMLGLRKPKFAIPGTDFCGIIEELGKDVKGFELGDHVIAETGTNCGAFAEYIAFPQDEPIVKIPNDFSPEKATGILDGGSTALAFFTDNVELKPGIKILINGASGSIGTAAIQLAKYFGAEVTGITSTRNKALVKDLGADFVIDYTTGELDNNTEKYDVIFDTVGKMSYLKSKILLSKNGVFLTPVLTGKMIMNLLFVSPFSKQKLVFAATGMRKTELRKRDLIRLKDLMVEGYVDTVLDRVYPMEQIQDAQTYVDGGHKRGNVVITM